jgi:hypothetical protein
MERPAPKQTSTRSSNTTTMLWALATITLFTPQTSDAGGVCMVVKKLGNSLAIEWIASEDETVDSASEKAKALLQQQGFTRKKLQDIHVQASTSLAHGHMIIIKSEYETKIGKLRTSYGCGFSHASSTEAESVAINNLRSYSWGWKQAFGYELYARHSY